MRLKERIPIVLSLLNLAQFLHDNNNLGLTENECLDVLVNYSSLRNSGELQTYWETNHNLRLVQVLVNLGIVEKEIRLGLGIEETEYLIVKGLAKFEELHFWGVNFTKEKVKLPQTIFVRLVDLGVDHIREILNHFDKVYIFGAGNLPYRYKEYFNRRLKQEGAEQTENLLRNLFEENSSDQGG